MVINQFLSNLEKFSQSLSKKFVFFKIFKPIYFFGSLFLFSIISFSMIVNENLKKKRAEEINSFLTNNQTLLLRNYIFNKIKSPLDSNINCSIMCGKFKALVLKAGFMFCYSNGFNI